MRERSAKDWLKMFAVIFVISAFLAAINPFTHNHFLGFSIIFFMFGGTAIPFHIFTMKRNKIKPEYYTNAGAISGAIVGMGYLLISPFVSDSSKASITGVLLFGAGGIILGILCSSIFWQVVVSKRYRKDAKSEELEERQFNAKISLLNIIGLVFGYTIISWVTETVYPVLLREEITGPLMTAYGVFTFSFPFVFLIANIFIVRFLVKGSLHALLFILFELAVVIAKSFYNLPLDIKVFSALLAIVSAVICFFVLRDMAKQTFSEKQKTAFRVAMFGAIFLLAGHMLTTGFLTFNRNYSNHKRGSSGEWHSQFQPQEMQETEQNAETACILLKGELKTHPSLAFEDRQAIHLNKPMFISRMQGTYQNPVLVIILGR